MESLKQDWIKRNKHVVEMHDIAHGIVFDLINNDHPKSDIHLLSELIKDIANRLD